MPPLSWTVLPEADRRRIIDAAFDLVDRVGVQVEDESLGARLTSAGGRSDRGSGRVRMPREMVEDLLGRAPQPFRLETIGGDGFHVGAGDRRVVSLVLDPVIVDYDEGVRAPCLADVARHARLGDALPLVNATYKMDQGLRDVPIDAVNATTLFEFLTNTTNHVTGNPADMPSALLWVEMVEAILDGATIKDRPVLSFGCHVTSPLRLGRFEAELMQFAADRWIPVSAGSCPMAGASSPFTLAGTLVQCVAETLWHVAAFQVLQPGLSVLTGASVFAFNMRVGDVSAGAAETTLMDAAYIELMHDLGMPVSGCIGFADPPDLDVQLGAEAALAQLAMVLSGADSLNGLGTIGNASGVSAEKIVIDHDLIEMADRIRTGISVDDDALAVDAIAEVALGGDFMVHDHTVARLRSGEHYYGGSFGRGGPGHFSGSMCQKAHDRVEAIVDAHEADVPDERKQALAEVARRHGAAL